MDWETHPDGTVDLSVSRDEFAVLSLCLSRATTLLSAEVLRAETNASPAELEALSWLLLEAQGDYHRKFGGGPVLEIS